ncbi:MAG: dienelactone hydrolase family protein [Deltaproteobacteria bacterium]|nr:dienelactone hydrolase family protein [Deltaproteobacteria bacterium]
MGSMISFEGNGKTCQGYLAPAASGKGPGVIVLQEWWGLVPHIKDVADRFAAEGFTALAPDLYEGKTADGPDEAGRMMAALNIAETEKVLRGAADTLASHEACASEKIGVIGFCMGGQLAMLAGALNPKVGAVANYYGIHPAVNVDFTRLGGPVLGIFAETDEFVNAEAVAGLEAQLKKAGKTMTTHLYKGVGHAFFNDTRPDVYDAGAAKDAWAKTLAFFRSNL